jgi:Alpha-L-arabinofuranosidase B (ABFB) domain
MPFRSLQAFQPELRNHFIRHRFGLGELTPIVTELDKRDATFYIFAGEFLIGSQVHLQASNFLDSVLRHENFRIKLHEFTTGLDAGPETPEHKLLREDCSFILMRGLADPSNPFSVSFRSFNFPTRFIRHRDFHLFLEEPVGDLGLRDATFTIVDPLIGSIPTSQP